MSKWGKKNNFGVLEFYIEFTEISNEILAESPLYREVLSY
jgi:hypothetical protein